MAFIGGSHFWRKHDHLVGHRKGVGKILLAKGLVTYRLELVRAPTCLGGGLKREIEGDRVSPSPECPSAMSAFSQQLASTCMLGARAAPPDFGH